MADDEMVAWLTTTLDEIEQRHGNPNTDPESWCDRAGGWHMEPQAVMARVEAERLILRVHVPDRDESARGDPMCVCCSDTIDYGGMAVGEWPCETVRLLAYGHRFDVPGYRDEWRLDA